MKFSPHIGSTLILSLCQTLFASESCTVILKPQSNFYTQSINNPSIDALYFAQEINPNTKATNPPHLEFGQLGNTETTKYGSVTFFL